VGLANRNITFPAQDDLNWKDISYRSGLVYDVRGDGKTAVRFAANKYLLGQTLNGLGTNPNPILTLQTTTFAFVDRFEQELRARLQPGESGRAEPDRDRPADNCGAIAPVVVRIDEQGRALRSRCPDRLGPQAVELGILGGYPAATAVPDVGGHQLLPPHLAELRGRRQHRCGGQRVPGVHHDGADRFAAPDQRPTATYYNVVPAKLGAQTLYHSLSDKYGSQYEHWNGLDIVVNGRLQNGLRFQAGLSTGRSSADNCAVVAALPEMLTFGSVNAAGLGTQQPGTSIAQQFCHEAEPWLTTFKAFEAYTIPKSTCRSRRRSAACLASAAAATASARGLRPISRRPMRIWRPTPTSASAHGHDGGDAERHAEYRRSGIGVSRSRQRAGSAVRQSRALSRPAWNDQRRSVQRAEQEHRAHGERGVRVDQQRVVLADSHHQSATAEGQSDAGHPVAITPG